MANSHDPIQLEVAFELVPVRHLNNDFHMNYYGIYR